RGVSHRGGSLISSQNDSARRERRPRRYTDRSAFQRRGRPCLRRRRSSLCPSRGPGASQCRAASSAIAPAAASPGITTTARGKSIGGDEERIAKMETVLTGITTTGAPHIGNYVGAIRPAIAASKNPNTSSFLFL